MINGIALLLVSIATSVFWVGYFNGLVYWPKKKARPLERLRAQGLEDLLNGSEPEFAQGSDIPGHQYRQEAEGIVSKLVEQEAERLRQQIDSCFCPVCKSRLWLDIGDSGFVLRTPTTQTGSPQESPAKQTLEPQTATQLNSRHAMEPGQTYRLSEHQSQTGNEISGNPEEINTWDWCPYCHQSLDPNIHKVCPQHPL